MLRRWLGRIWILPVLALAAMGAIQIGIVLIGGWHYSIPSGSMEPTLPQGEALLATALADDAVPPRGTMAVFEHPTRPGETYIKRIVGLPGEQIQMIGGALSIDTVPVERTQVEDYALTVGKFPPAICRDRGNPCMVPQWEETLPGGVTHRVLDFGQSPKDNTGAMTVPDGHVFVLGDSRDNSIDSRFPTMGFIPIANLRHEPWVFYISRWKPFAFERLFQKVGP